MESEVELHETLQELHVIATNPDLYPTMVELNAVPSLLELLSHENTDIAVAVVDLLQDLTDVDVMYESMDGADVLITALLEQQVCALLVQNLERLDETIKEESSGVHNTLGILILLHHLNMRSSLEVPTHVSLIFHKLFAAIFENFFEYRPNLCVDAGKQGLMNWLLKRIKAKMPFDPNKLYASEILAILLQDSTENRKLLGDLDGIDVLLQQLAVIFNFF